jgi:hypothetical protein
VSSSGVESASVAIQAAPMLETAFGGGNAATLRDAASYALAFDEVVQELRSLTRRRADGPPPACRGGRSGTRRPGNGAPPRNGRTARFCGPMSKTWSARSSGESGKRARARFPQP